MTTSEPTTPTRPPRRGTRDRKRSILSAAERLFAERGYARASMKEIAAAVGITDAALYKHFDSKREILEVLYEERGFFRAIEVLEHLPGKLDMEAQFRVNVLASTDLWANNTDFLRVIFMEALVGDLMAIDVHLSVMDRWRKGIERLFLLYAERGEVDPALAEDFSGMVVNLLFGAFMDRLLTQRPTDGELPFSDPAFRTRLTSEVTRLVAACRLPHARRS